MAEEGPAVGRVGGDVLPTPRRRRGVPPWWPAAVAGVVALALVGVVITLDRPEPRTDPRSADAGRDSSVSSSPTTSPPPSASATPSTAPTSAAAAASPASPAPYNFATARSGTIPSGYYRYVDERTGFSLAIPNRWKFRLENGRVRFTEPGGGRFLLIEQTNQPKPDPVADWTAQEKKRIAEGDFPGYKRVRIVPVKYFAKAADWELTYNDGGPLHVLNRGFVTSPTKAYSLYWSTPAGQWAESTHYFEVFAATFQPAG